MLDAVARALAHNCAQWLKAWYACAQGMVVLFDFVVLIAADVVAVAIMQCNRHVVRLRTRPCCCCQCVM